MSKIFVSRIFCGILFTRNAKIYSLHQSCRECGVRLGLRFQFDHFEKIITPFLLWNTSFFYSIVSDWVSCLHVDTKMSIEIFKVTQILDISTNLFHYSKGYIWLTRGFWLQIILRSFVDCYMWTQKDCIENFQEFDFDIFSVVMA